MTPVEPEVLVLRPGRAGIVASGLAGIGFSVIGIVMVVSGRGVGWAAVALGAVGLLAFAAGIVPGAASLRLDPQGFRVKAPTRSWGAAWPEVEGFRVDRIPVGRNATPSEIVRVDYREGFAAAHTPRRRLRGMPGIDERIVVRGYGGRSAPELAALLEEWRSRYG